MKYQIVIQFPYLSENDFDNLINLENKLEQKLGNNHLVDGHDIGSGEMNIFIHTNEPEKAFNIIKDTITQNELHRMIAAYRELSKEKYTIIFPNNFSGEFEVK